MYPNRALLGMTMVSMVTTNQSHFYGYHSKAFEILYRLVWHGTGVNTVVKIRVEVKLRASEA